jgi:hypothetical protein
VGDKIKIKKVGDVNGIIGSGTQTTTPEIKEDGFFKKYLVYVGLVAGFVYFIAVLWAAYDLQQHGMLGNKTFKEIVLAPIPLIKTDEKK